MDNLDKEFLKRILETFRIEAKEHLQLFEDGLAKLEHEQTPEMLSQLIEVMFREVHSLKGAARSVGQKEIESICQPLESLFSSLKKREISLTPVALELIYKSKDVLSDFILNEATQSSPSKRQSIRELGKQLIELASGEISAEPIKEAPVVKPVAITEIQPVIEPAKPVLPLIEPLKAEVLTEEPEPAQRSAQQEHTRLVFNEAVRIPVSKLDPLLLQAEELLQSNLQLSLTSNDLKNIYDDIFSWKTQSEKLRQQQKLITVSDWNHYLAENELQLNKIEAHLLNLTRSFEKETYGVDRIANDHLNAIKQIMMLPVSSLVEVFPGMVREMSRNLQKKIGFNINGAELEVSKQILEELKDPLTHLIRNSIDHGIEYPNERELQGKPPKGMIKLSFAAKENGLFEIVISDDGRGINKNKLLRSAIKNGIVSTEQAEKMTHDEILALMYHSGVSTNSIITDLSGRGLGMSIVLEKIEKLNGRLLIETIESQGTTFRIILPMTMATFRGLAVKVNESVYMLPTMNVERVLRVKADEITTVENFETICLDDVMLSVVSLADALGLPRLPKGATSDQALLTQTDNHVRMVLLSTTENRIAFKVDEVIDEHQILVKGLGKLLKRVRNISGATILGSGKIVPVIHVGDLMKSAVQIKHRVVEQTVSEKPVHEHAKILVAEDSITSRTMLKNILETAGYLVTVAVDGADAFAKAKTDTFDLILTDVDMPRMNGFELTTKIKKDAHLSEIPVVLCTSLESREDKERGVEAGADAYIVKNSFSQGNLLEIIKRLI